VFAGYETQKWLHGLWILEARSSPMKYDDTNDTYSPQFGQLAPAAPRGGLLLVVATSEGLDGDLFLPLLGQQEDVAGLGVMADEMCNVRSFTRTRVIEMRWQAHTLRETLASFVEERGTGELTKRMMAARVWDDESELLSRMPRFLNRTLLRRPRAAMHWFHALAYDEEESPWDEEATNQEGNEPQAVEPYPHASSPDARAEVEAGHGGGVPAAGAAGGEAGSERSRGDEGVDTNASRGDMVQVVHAFGQVRAAAALALAGLRCMRLAKHVHRSKWADPVRSRQRLRLGLRSSDVEG